MSSVCSALLKKVVSPSNCKITKWISFAQDLLGWINLKSPSANANVGNAAVWDGLTVLITIGWILIKILILSCMICFSEVCSTQVQATHHHAHHRPGPPRRRAAAVQRGHRGVRLPRVPVWLHDLHLRVQTEVFSESGSTGWDKDSLQRRVLGQRWLSMCWRWRYDANTI